MPAGLSFKKDDKTTDATNLKDVRIITLEDSGGSKYTLDITGNDLKVEYIPSGGEKVEKTITGLATALGAILGATEDTDVGPKSILVQKLGDFLDETSEMNEKVYGADSNDLKIAKDFLADKYPLVKTDGSNATKELANAILTIDGDTSGTSVLKEKAANKNVAEAILGATESTSDGKTKSILVEKLGDFLPGTDAVYGSGTKKIAKDFLAEKGLKPTPEELAANSDFANAVAVEVNSNDPKFQGSVREVMSQPVFEIPADENAPLSWDW